MVIGVDGNMVDRPWQEQAMLVDVRMAESLFRRGDYHCKTTQEWEGNRGRSVQ